MIIVKRGTPHQKSPGVTVDTAFHYLPYPKPVLPSGGGTFTDPTFGSVLIRVTDASSAPSGVEMMSDGEDMQWNADGTLFIFKVVGTGYKLYSVNRTTYAITDYGALNATTVYDGAQWHPTDPAVLFAGDSQRTIYKLVGLPTNPGQTPTLVHDFTAQIPGTGFSSSRIGVSDTARYVMMTASSLTGLGQDNFDYIVIWDTQTNNVAASLYMQDHYAPAVYLHSSDMIPGDTYVRLGGTTSGFGSVFWNWQTDTLSSSVTDTGDNFAAHKSFGLNLVYNPAVGSGGPGSDTWLTRSLVTPHSYSTLLTYPMRGGIHSYAWDSHGSKVLPGGGFTDDPQYLGTSGALMGWTWVLHAGAVWKIPSFSATGGNGYATTFGPDTMWAGTSTLGISEAIPTASGTFFYDSAADVFYARLPDDSDPNAADFIGVTGWVPCLDEIVLNYPSAGSWITRRYCHHRARGDRRNFATYPLAHPDPTGRFVLFQSNWDVYNGRTDAFIVDGETSRS